MKKLHLLTSLILLQSSLAEQEKESDFYTITPFKIPNGESVESGAFALMENGKVAVATRRGKIWVVKNALEHPAKQAEWSVFAEYLHEPLGLAYKNGWLYALQRPELTRLKDTNGDGFADKMQSVSDQWGINGNNHEYNFGSQFSRDGKVYCALCLTRSFHSRSLFRGWVLSVDENGKTEPFACGIRSPGGIGFDAAGEVFYTDNQGTWNGSSSLKWLKKGSFQGNPNGNVHFKFTDQLGTRPPDPDFEKPSRSHLARKNIPTYVPPAVWFPHGKVGQSPTGIATDESKGKFGPFSGQMFVAEQTHSEVQRVFLEKVNGIYQGAVFEFLSGFKSGNIGLMITQDGQMFTGGSNRGWGASGPDSNSFERIDWTGKIPFEILEMKIQKDGFVLNFTKEVDPQSIQDSSFRCKSYTYEYFKNYGSKEVDKRTHKVSVVSISEDKKSVRVKVDPLAVGSVHEFSAEGVRSTDGKKLLHHEAFYTVNEVPQ